MPAETVATIPVAEQPHKAATTQSSQREGSPGHQPPVGTAWAWLGREGGAPSLLAPPLASQHARDYLGFVAACWAWLGSGLGTIRSGLSQLPAPRLSPSHSWCKTRFSVIYNVTISSGP